MNYFEFYDLPLKFNLDVSRLKRLFLLKSKATHPDYFTLASKKEQAIAMEQATLNNQAYKMLADKSLRTKYILELLGALKEDEKQQLPMAFLMEMMELNEQIQDAHQNPILTEKIKRQLTIKMSDIETKEQIIFDLYDRAEDSKDLDKIKDFYFEHKYLLQAFNQLDE